MTLWLKDKPRTPRPNQSPTYRVDCPDCPWLGLPSDSHEQALASARRHWEFNHGPDRHQELVSVFDPEDLRKP